jgi:hypothetical protein
MGSRDPFDDDGEALDDPFADEPGGELPVERFVEELEQMMIAGHSINSIRRWAMTSYSVDDSMLSHFQDMIRRSWALEQQTVGQIRRRRDHLRVKYLQVFDAAMKLDKFMPAVKALDSIAKLDGLAEPDVNLTQINVGGQVQGAHSGQITNGVRERIKQLADTMKLRAEQRALRNTQIIDLAEAKKGVG